MSTNDFTSYRNLTFTNENRILSFYRDADDKILAFPEGEAVEAVYKATHDADNWKYWVDSSGKADKTPDFYSDKFLLMMEVMRIDDRAYRKGKRNPALERESTILRELANGGVLDSISGLKHIHLNAVTCLPTDEDHNFIRFRDNFVRVVKSHGQQNETYRKNHPGHKLVFFIFDETSGVYYKKIDEKQGEHHYYWADSVLVNAIIESKADFVIWFKPYNAYETTDGMQDDLPKLMIYETANMKIETIEYFSDQMISSEV